MLEEYMNKNFNQRPFFVICDNIRSLENIGSIFRTADALAVDKIFLGGICGQPPRSKISRAALGAEKWMLWQYHRQVWRLVEKLKKQGVFIVVLEQNKRSVPFNKFKPRFPLALVLGNEIKGVSPALLKRADCLIYLPMLGRKESLNVSVAFGAAGYWINGFRMI